MKNLILIAVGIIVLSIFSCGDDTASPKSNPKVSFINAVTGLSLPQFVTAQIKDSATFYNRVAFGSASTPKELTIGSYPMTFLDGTNKNLFSTNYNFNGDKNIAIILCNTASTPEFLSVESSIKTSTDTTGTVRFVNLIANSSINIKLNGTSLSTTSFKGFTQAIDLDPNVGHTVEISSTSLPIPITIPNYRVGKGKYLLAFLTGSVTGTPAPSINTLVF
ncbi:MAG: DUF4397 domain-containing protein [Saprospiraceae bacterium]|nr:DUF4397 domain-containing protein [Saprospiraceae bacterium]